MHKCPIEAVQPRFWQYLVIASGSCFINYQFRCRLYLCGLNHTVKPLRQFASIEIIVKLSYSITHNQSKTNEYKIWANILQRCYNKNNLVYKWYGQRGIITSEEWKTFENFIKDYEGFYQM